MDCLIRKGGGTNAPAISMIVEAALRKSNAQDPPPPNVIDQIAQSFSPSDILKFLSALQVYVSCIDPMLRRQEVSQEILGAMDSRLFNRPKYRTAIKRLFSRLK